ncbi:MAG: M20/M25/M40 family metallo-hydrolase [Armatimonadetes bacterium]|nr:M20/M25/M40 family metallo-hydrolase [Armatimonadota bacterium]
MLNALNLIRDLVALPGPPGQEEAVRAAVAAHAGALGCAHEDDARGNLLIAPPAVGVVPQQPNVVVMAHLDEIALLVVRVEEDGRLVVTNLGGLLPWKWGEGPVTILTPGAALTGILSFGSLHSNARENPATRAREEALTWDMARVFTGLSVEDLAARGVRPGTRVALHPSRRTVTEFGDFLAAPFLDDRADLAAMLLALESLSGSPRAEGGVLFAATAAEEVGGHGALWLLQRHQPAVAVALEIGPRVPESRFPLDAQPTVWVNDGYSAMQARDIDLVAAAADDAGLSPHWQALSRGGSDASCAASHGLVARPITLAFAAENSHGCEIMHRDAVANLSRLLLAVLDRLAREEVTSSSARE